MRQPNNSFLATKTQTIEWAPVGLYCLIALAIGCQKAPSFHTNPPAENESWLVQHLADSSLDGRLIGDTAIPQTELRDRRLRLMEQAHGALFFGLNSDARPGTGLIDLQDVAAFRLITNKAALQQFLRPLAACCVTDDRNSNAFKPEYAVRVWDDQEHRQLELVFSITERIARSVHPIGIEFCTIPEAQVSALEEILGQIEWQKMVHVRSTDLRPR